MLYPTELHAHGTILPRAAFGAGGMKAPRFGGRRRAFGAGARRFARLGRAFGAEGLATLAGAQLAIARCGGWVPPPSA